MRFRPPAHPAHRTIYALAMLLAVLLGCEEKSTKPADPVVDQVPDFTLEDRNPNSSTHGQMISPGKYHGQISGWYFVSAT